MEAVFPLPSPFRSTDHPEGAPSVPHSEAPPSSGPSLSVLLSPPDCPTTPLLIQSAVTHGCCGCNVLVVAPSRLHRLPPTVRGMPSPTPHSMASVRFLYAEDRFQLQRYLASVHLMPHDDRPTHLVVTHLQHYATHPPLSDALSQTVTASKLLSLLLETVHFTTSYRDPSARFPGRANNASCEEGGTGKAHGNEDVARDEKGGTTGANNASEVHGGVRVVGDLANDTATKCSGAMAENGVGSRYHNQDDDRHAASALPNPRYPSTPKAMRAEVPLETPFTQSLTSPDAPSPTDRGLENHPFLRPREVDSDSDVDIETFQNTLDFSKNQYSLLDSWDVADPRQSLERGTQERHGKALSCEEVNKPVEDHTKWKNFCSLSKCSGSVTVGWVSEGPPSSVLTRPSDVEFVARHLGFTVWSVNSKYTSPYKQQIRNSVPLFEASADGRDTLVYRVTTDAVQLLTEERSS